MSKRPAPVHGLHVLAPVPKPRRIFTVDSGGGPLRALAHCGEHTARKPLASPDAIRGVKNQGGSHRKGVGGEKGRCNGKGAGQQIGQGGDNTYCASGDDSGARGASSTGDHESLIEGADGKSGAVKDHRGWNKLTRRHG